MGLREPLTVGLILLGGLSMVGLDAQSRPMVQMAEPGKECVGAGPREVPPPIGFVAAMCPLEKKDVRDADGRVVTGIGLYVWTDAKLTHVRVFTMIPAPGAPNRWLNELGDDQKLLRPKLLAEYTMTLGQSRSIVEMKALGVPPMELRFTDQSRAVTPAKR